MRDLNNSANDIMDVLELLLIANDGNPIDWDIQSRTALLSNYTRSTWLLALSIACYPLSAASVVFYGEPDCP